MSMEEAKLLAFLIALSITLAFKDLQVSVGRLSFQRINFV
jgi:hypothetical protein